MMTTIKAGDKAPVFTGLNQEGKRISLEDFIGKKVVLYFYPKNNTPSCTTQACNLRDNHTGLLQEGYQVIGISPDTVESHKKFALKYDLPFTLIADADKVIANAYGVWGPKNFMGKTYDGINRTTFIINEEGIIEKVIEKVKTKNHFEQIIEE